MQSYSTHKIYRGFPEQIAQKPIKFSMAELNIWRMNRSDIGPALKVGNNLENLLKKCTCMGLIYVLTATDLDSVKNVIKSL